MNKQIDFEELCTRHQTLMVLVNEQIDIMRKVNNYNYIGFIIDFLFKHEFKKADRKSSQYMNEASECIHKMTALNKRIKNE